MIRPAVTLLILSTSLFAAPVPKEARAKSDHVGKWQNVYVDAKNPAKITSRGQFWYLGEDGSFTYQDEGAPGPPPKTTSSVSGRLKCPASACATLMDEGRLITNPIAP